SAADLAIAIGILIGSEQFTARAGRAAMIGEVSLGGEVRPVPGLLPMVAALARRGVGRVNVPAYGIARARALVACLQPASTRRPLSMGSRPFARAASRRPSMPCDRGDVRPRSLR